MKRSFTKLIAALALLAFMTPTMAGWGQTRETISLTFSLTSNPGGWTTTNSTTLTNYTYSLSGVNYTFALKNVKCNSGYLMMTSTAVLGLPAIDGYKLTTVVASNSSGCSTSTKVGISSSATQESYISGGAIQTWSTTSSSYTYNLTSTEANTMYYMYVTNKNAQVVELALTYESTGDTPVPSMSVSTNSIDFGSNEINPANPYTETFNVTFANLKENLMVTGFTGVSVSPSTINYDATSPQTVTVTYNPTEAGSISGNISVNSSEVTEALVAVTGSAYDPANVDTYEKYTGAIVEGDYVIYNTNGAMKSEISSSRFANQSVTISGTTITNPDASAVWHIAPSGNYWTIYNASVNKYAGGTSSKNQGALLDDATDNHALWTITYQYSNFTIENYGRSQDSSDPNNKYLRQNSTSGWATYGSGTGSVPQLYKKVVANQVAMPTFNIAGGTYYETQSISLSCETSDATIYYTTDGTTPSSSNGTEYTTAISVSTTTTINAIAVKSGMADSDVATATYTIEQPYSTIPALFAAATAVEQDVRVTFGNWVVSGVSTNGKNVYVTDNSGNGFIIYFTSDMSGTFSAGKILSGTAVACKLKLYNGAAELVNLNASDLTVTAGGTVSIVNIAMASLSGVNTGALVHYDDLTCSLDNNKYYLSDGTTTLQAYNTLYDFNQFKDGKNYNVTGVYVQYNNTKEIAPRSAADIEEVVVPIITVDPDSIEVDADGGNGTLDLTYENMTIGNMNDFAIQYYNADGEEITDPNWLEVVVAEQDPNIGEGYVVSYDIYENEGEARTAYFKVFAEAGDDFVFSNLVTVEQAAPLTGDEYELYSGALVEGDYLIVYDGSAMNNSITNNRLQYASVSAINDVITTDNAEIVWHIAPSGDNWTIYSANVQKYAASTNSNNQAQLVTEGTEGLSDNAKWVITAVNSDPMTYEFVNVARNTGTDPHAYLRNNKNTTTNYGFACYATSTGGALSLYKKVEDTPVTETYELTINGYGNNTDGWYLIASPVSTTPDQVTNMLTDETVAPYSFDLYRFNQAGTDGEWENYHQHQNDFNIVPGQGYLYANKGDVDNNPNEVTLTFTGEPYDGDGIIELKYDDDAADNMKGWNLVGNPFYSNVTVDAEEFMIMNGEGSDIVLAEEGDIIAPMQGIFVHADEEGKSVTFIRPVGNAHPNSNPAVVMNLTQNRSNVIDRAIVRFGEGKAMPKFQLFENNTKLSIAQDGEDFSVVRSNAQGEMPVNFKAKEDGQYTITVNPENVEMSYLHLIDNMTGADVDLNATPSYTFNAKSNDYESRFRLVFSAQGSNDMGDDFAFISNGTIILNGANDNATLQVVDMMGRIVSSEVVSGNSVRMTSVANGVYVLRLINGNEVKTQKIVVE